MLRSLQAGFSGVLLATAFVLFSLAAFQLSDGGAMASAGEGSETSLHVFESPFDRSSEAPDSWVSELFNGESSSQKSSPLRLKLSLESVEKGGEPSRLGWFHLSQHRLGVHRPKTLGGTKLQQWDALLPTEHQLSTSQLPLAAARELVPAACQALSAAGDAVHEVESVLVSNLAELYWAVCLRGGLTAPRELTIVYQLSHESPLSDLTSAQVAAVDHFFLPLRSGGVSSVLRIGQAREHDDGANQPEDDGSSLWGNWSEATAWVMDHLIPAVDLTADFAVKDCAGDLGTNCAKAFFQESVGLPQRLEFPLLVMPYCRKADPSAEFAAQVIWRVLEQLSVHESHSWGVQVVALGCEGDQGLGVGPHLGRLMAAFPRQVRLVVADMNKDSSSRALAAADLFVSFRETVDLAELYAAAQFAAVPVFASTPLTELDFENGVNAFWVPQRWLKTAQMEDSAPRIRDLYPLLQSATKSLVTAVRVFAPGSSKDEVLQLRQNLTLTWMRAALHQRDAALGGEELVEEWARQFGANLDAEALFK